MKRIILLLLYISAIVCSLHAAALGTWRLYPSYSSIDQVETSGSDVYVRSNGNLYTYHVSDGSLQTYDKTNGLNSINITNIAWVPSAKKLLIIYSDYLFDLLDAQGNVTSMTALRDYSTNKNKTVTGVRVSGKYAYVITEVATMKIDARDEYVVETYKAGTTVPDLPAETAKEQGPNGSLTYDASNHCYWGANADGKLTKYAKSEDGIFTAQTGGVAPDGPVSNQFWRLTKSNDVIYATNGIAWHVNVIDRPGLVQTYNVKSSEWGQLQAPDMTGKDYEYISSTWTVADPSNANHLFVGSTTGLYEYQDGKCVQQYNIENSTLTASYSHRAYITSLLYDNSGKLWVFNGFNRNPINTLAKDGTWKNYPHANFTGGLDSIRSQEGAFISKKNGKMWFANASYHAPAIYAYDYTTDDLTRIDQFVNQDGTSLGKPIPFRMTEDNDGNIWVASDAGPFYLSHSNITKNNFVFTQHKVARNDNSGLADYLLDGVETYVIKIDAANRKWIGTNGAGIFLISSDNNTELANFTTDNSPLPSNSIYDILIDDETGIVYIVTEDGFCFYQSDVTTDNATEINESAVYAYPNPVSPDYTGNITIVGLIEKCQLKIMSPSGRVVHSGVSAGGSYTWDGRDSTGERVASGVYSVLVTTPEGESGAVTKIAIVK